MHAVRLPFGYSAGFTILVTTNIIITILVIVNNLVTIFDTISLRFDVNLFVSRLKELISESGKMQKDICLGMGVPKQKLTRWKTGYNEPSLDELIMIADYFNVTVDFLLGLEDETGTKTPINKK